MYHQPTSTPYSSSGFNHASYPYGTGSYSNSQSHIPSSTNSSSVHSQSNSLMSRMDERSAFSLLQHLGKDELSHLLENDEKLQDLINDLPQVKGIQEEHDNVIASNKSIAEYNLSLQPRLEDLKQTVASGYEQQNSLKNSLAVDKAELDTFVSRQSLDTLLALLQTETAKAEEETEALTSDFYENSLEMEEFLTQFMARRTLMHLRRLRSEKMAELIRDGSLNTPASTTNTTPYPMGGINSIGAPYPSGGSFSMPQPRLPY